MSRRPLPGPVRVAGFCLLGAAVLAAPLWGPRVLRHVGWFEIARVEVSGTRLLAPQEVLAAARVRPGQNVWEDPSRWEQALRAHPAVHEAEVTRQLPRSLRIRIREKQPVAFLETGTLHPVTAAGELLPLDPARSPVDLPILRVGRHAGPQSALSDTSVARLLDTLGRLQRLDPALSARISEVRADGADLRLMLARPAAEILLPGDAADDEQRLRELGAVIADLEQRLPAPNVDAGAPASLDARFADQVVVRIPSSA